MFELLHPDEFYYKPEMYSFPRKITLVTITVSTNSVLLPVIMEVMFLWPKYKVSNNSEMAVKEKLLRELSCGYLIVHSL